jgi:uncharacterized protein
MRASCWTALFACASLFIATPAAAQSVKAGVDAWAKGDYVGAVTIWRPLADAGDADACFNMGQAYRLGRGVLVDLSVAQTWLARAAEKGHVDGQATLGLLLFQNGNQTEGLRWLKAAAEKGDARAMLVYGTALFNGDSVAQDPVLGYAYVSRAAAQGLEPAKSTLSQMDEIMPLAQRKKAVALAMRKAKTETAPKKAGPKPASAKSASKSVETADAKLSASRKAESRDMIVSAGGWYLQLGAFSQRSSADALYQKLASGPPVGGKQKLLVPAGNVTRLQVGPFETRTAAAAACSSLAKRGQPCFPVAHR